MATINWNQKIEDWVNQQSAYMVELLQQLVNFKSVNQQYTEHPGESESAQLQDFVQDFFQSLGLAVDRWDVYDGQPNVVATLTGKEQSNTLILNGHIDVVPTGDLTKWSVDPWKGEVREGMLYGRGSSDMKAGVVCNLMIAKFFKEIGIELESDLQFHVVVDEECGGAGARSVLEHGYTGAGVIITEPTGHIIMPVAGGVQDVRVTIKGLSAHSGWRYSHIHPGYGLEGVNVIEKAVKIMNAVLELERDWGRTRNHPLFPSGYVTMNPGVIMAGIGSKNGMPEIITAPSVVPDYCVIDFNMKYLPTEKAEDVNREFAAFIDHVALTDSWLRANPPTVEFAYRGNHYPPVDTPLDHKIIKVVTSSEERFGLPSIMEGNRTVSDATFYSNKGIPSVVYGPIGGQFHGPDEYVDLDSLYQTTKVLIMSVLEWQGIISHESQ